MFIVKIPIRFKNREIYPRERFYSDIDLVMEGIGILVWLCLFLDGEASFWPLASLVGLGPVTCWSLLWKLKAILKAAKVEDPPGKRHKDRYHSTCREWWAIYSIHGRQYAGFIQKLAVFWKCTSFSKLTISRVSEGGQRQLDIWAIWVGNPVLNTRRCQAQLGQCSQK